MTTATVLVWGRPVKVHAISQYLDDGRVVVTVLNRFGPQTIVERDQIEIKALASKESE